MIAISRRGYAAMIVLTAMLASGCSAARPLHRSPAAIRSSLLKSTPPGTPKKDVVTKIGWRVWESGPSAPYAAQAQESNARNTLRWASNQKGSAPVPKELKSVLDFEFGGYFIWFGTCYVYGVYGFDSEDRLLDVWVYKARDTL